MRTSSNRARASNNSSILIALVCTILCAVPIACFGIYLLKNLTPEAPARKEVANQTRTKAKTRTSPRHNSSRSTLDREADPQTLARDDRISTPAALTEKKSDSVAGTEYRNSQGLSALSPGSVDVTTPAASKTASALAPFKVRESTALSSGDDRDRPVFDLRDAVELNFPNRLLQDAKTELGRIRDTQLNKFHVAIDGGAADIEVPFEYRVSEGERAHTWEIGLFPKTDVKSSELAKFEPRRKVALVSIQERSFNFIIPSKQAANAAQLRNCVLTISSDAHRHNIQLRSPKKIGTITLKLDGPRVIPLSDEPLPDDALPKSNRVYLELISIEHSSTTFVVEPPSRKMRMHKGPSSNEQLIVAKFEEWPEAGIEFDLVASDNKPRVVINPYFIVEQKKQLSLDKLSQTVIKMKKSIVDQENSLKKQKALLADYRSRLSGAQSSSPRNTAEAAVLTKLISDLTKHVNRIPKKIKDIEERIPKTKATFENLEKLQKIVQEVHGSTSIQLQVTCKADRHAIDLLQVGSSVVEKVDE